MKHSIIVALDEHNQENFDDVLSQLDPGLCMVKIGSVSFNSLGRDCVIKAAEKGFDIFLDLKLHDIPNTVKKSIDGLVNLPIKMMTVHASGGQKMLEESVAATMNTDIKIFGVTALTSLSDTDTNFIYKREAKEQVLAMIELAKKSSIHGVVCSPQELSLVKNNSNLLTITPGIRPKSLDDDQTRVMTPKEAIDNGSDFLVIGRPITASNNIKNSLKEIYDSIQ
ncbi:orotidine-5'-phosphate decarboxylase [Gammaproteobacteria bacterium]|nr:orotidine-5'-phosphate decarboxylase [Gammaproteobacteria bacterium]